MAQRLTDEVAAATEPRAESPAKSDPSLKRRTSNLVPEARTAGRKPCNSPGRRVHRRALSSSSVNFRSAERSTNSTGEVRETREEIETVAPSISACKAFFETRQTVAVSRTPESRPSFRTKVHEKIAATSTTPVQLQPAEDAATLSRRTATATPSGQEVNDADTNYRV